MRQQRLKRSFNRFNFNTAVEDRLNSLPDELIHRILSCLDMKFAVQTCLVSSRWKLLWTSMPCLNFSTRHFRVLRKFAEFVTNVLSHRNHQIQVSSVKLEFNGAANQGFVTQIANYAFSHNVQELTVANSSTSDHVYPPCLFSSQSLKHFTVTCNHRQLYTTTETPLDFPALTTLHITGITLCGDLFTKCVNLKNLTLESFSVPVEVFDIITPQLSSLTLIDGICEKVLNLIAPQLENLTIRNCFIEHLNAPPGLSSLCYTIPRWNGLPQFSNHRFHSLSKVTISLSYDSYYRTTSYIEKDVCNTINLFQLLRSARYLTLTSDIVECLSTFPDLLSHHPSPFSNLICLTIDSSMMKDAYKVKMSSQARNFLLENSPHATFIMELPKVRSRR